MLVPNHGDQMTRVHLIWRQIFCRDREGAAIGQKMPSLQLVANVFQRFWIRRLDAVFQSRILSAAHFFVLEKNFQRRRQHIDGMRRSCRQRRQILHADLLLGVSDLLSMGEATDREARRQHTRRQEWKRRPRYSPLGCHGYPPAGSPSCPLVL